MPVRSTFMATVLVLATASAWGGPAQPGHLKVQLVSAAESVQPGSPLLLGLSFQLEDSWHIYWKNPGDSGEPPRIQWKLPPGFQAGEVRWPAPERMGSGSVIDFGYHGSVLLPVEIQTPGRLPAGGNVTLSAQVSWIVCKNICVAGTADLELTLPVRPAPGPRSASGRLFREASSRLPRPMPPAWRAEAISEKDRFVLTIQGAGPGQAAFFPLEADQIDNAAPQAALPCPGGLRLALRKSELLARVPARLEGVLELGPGLAYAVSAPVSPATGPVAPQ